MATLDKSLDEIITSRPKAGGRRGSRRGARGPSAPAANPTNTRARYAGAVPAANGNRVVSAPVPSAVQPDATKIIVSNLPFDVNEGQIKELFSSTVGSLREVNLHYDHKGVSKGVAAVVFHKKGDGNKAFTQYNNRLIDGKRPMKIEIVVDPARPPPPASLSQRVAPAPVATPIAANGAGAAQSSTRGRPAGGRAGGRGGGAGRGAGRRKGNDRPVKTAADLDAEMEDYTNPSAPAA